MGLLNIFSSGSQPATLAKLPSGSFTIDATGRLLTSTVPRTFPEELTARIGNDVLAAFRSASKAGVPLSQLVIHYSALRITARELRGGAIVFLSLHNFQRSQT